MTHIQNGHPVQRNQTANPAAAEAQGDGSSSSQVETPRADWLTLALVSLGLFLAVLSTTVVGVALPTIGRDLHAIPSDLEWVVDSYVVVYAAFLIAGGVAGDRRGRKGLYLLGVALFGVGALIVGLASSIAVLLAGRVIQGLGPALLVPGSLTIIRAVFTDPRRRAQAIGLWSTASGMALAVGPPLGGVIVSGLGWRWVFLLNAPLAAILIALAARRIPRLARTQPAARFDWPGLGLSTAGIALLAVGVIEGQAVAWTAPLVLASFIAGIVAIVGFVALEQRRSNPLIDISLFARPAFAAANLAAFAVFFAFVGAIVYFSAYFQQAQGHSAIIAGLDVAAIGIAYAIAATLSGRVVGRIGERAPLLTGLAVSGAATLALMRLQPTTSIWTIWPNFLVLGAGVGLCGTPISTAAMSAVEADHAGQASAVINAMRQVGQVFGVAVLGALVYADLPTGATGGHLPPAQATLFVTGLHHALLVAGIALLAAAAVAGALLHRPLHAKAEPGRRLPAAPNQPGHLDVPVQPGEHQKTIHSTGNHGRKLRGPGANMLSGSSGSACTKPTKP